MGLSSWVWGLSLLVPQGQRSPWREAIPVNTISTAMWASPDMLGFVRKKKMRLMYGIRLFELLNL